MKLNIIISSIEPNITPKLFTANGKTEKDLVYDIYTNCDDVWEQLDGEPIGDLIEYRYNEQISKEDFMQQMEFDRVQPLLDSLSECETRYTITN